MYLFWKKINSMNVTLITLGIFKATIKIFKKKYLVITMVGIVKPASLSCGIFKWCLFGGIS